MCNIAIKIPEAILYDTKMNKIETENFIRRLVALEYYKNQGVSIGYCAEIAGMNEEEFIKYLESVGKVTLAFCYAIFSLLSNSIFIFCRPLKSRKISKLRL